MKVLHVYKTYLPQSFGGVEQVIYEIISSTKKLGVQSQVLALTPNKKSPVDEANDHHVHWCRSHFEIASTPFSLPAFSQFKALSKQVDIIHYHFPWPVMDMMHFFAGVKNKSVVSYQSDIIRQKNLLRLYRPLMHRFLNSVGKIVATSPNYFSTSDVLQRYKDKTTIIPNGLSTENYSASDESTLAGWRAQLPSRFFLFIGVFRYYKGLSVLIEAAASTGYPVVIVGSGPMEQSLKHQVKKLGTTQVFFLGKLDNADKIALLELCYAVVFPSTFRSEAFGMTLLEGAMFKKPLISCEIGTGTSYINLDGTTGIVIPPNDSAALAQAMRSLWNHPSRAEEMGIQAQNRFLQLFTAKAMGESYVKLYQSLK